MSNINHQDVTTVATSIHHLFVEPDKMMVGPYHWDWAWVMKFQMEEMQRIQDEMEAVKEEEEEIRDFFLNP